VTDEELGAPEGTPPNAAGEAFGTGPAQTPARSPSGEPPTSPAAPSPTAGNWPGAGGRSPTSPGSPPSPEPGGPLSPEPGGQSPPPPTGPEPPTKPTPPTGPTTPAELSPPGGPLLSEATPPIGAKPSAPSPMWVRISRWTAGIVVLFLAAVLGGVAVVSGYVRDQVLDTETYVQTVTPLIADPAVQDALAARLANEIVVRTDLTGTANDVASRLVRQGAPARVEDLVPPLISGITSFLDTTIRKIITSPQFQTVWENMNRTAHTALVTVLTGTNSNLVKTNGKTVTIDLGQLLIPLKQQLVDRGLTFANRIPNVSIPYTIVTSGKLPKIRTYVRALNAVATWLPWVALAIFVGGVLAVPNRRRGIITGFVMLGVVDVLLLAGLAIGRSVYLDQLPSTVQSPDAAAVIYDTLLRYLNKALQSVLVAVIILVLAALLAGPSRPARWIRHQIGRLLNLAGEALGRTGTWAASTGRAIMTIRRPLEFILGVLGVVVFILANRPSVSAVTWLAFGIVMAIIVIEILARMTSAARGQPA
jgi:hypothetical protein